MWQPIETAPHNTELLVCVTYPLSQDEWQTVFWVDFYNDEDGWVYYPTLFWVPCKPTHWMPLPEPPK